MPLWIRDYAPLILSHFWLPSISLHLILLVTISFFSHFSFSLPSSFFFCLRFAYASCYLSLLAFQLHGFFCLLPFLNRFPPASLFFVLLPVCLSICSVCPRLSSSSVFDSSLDSSSCVLSFFFSSLFLSPSVLSSSPSSLLSYVLLMLLVLLLLPLPLSFFFFINLRGM